MGRAWTNMEMSLFISGNGERRPLWWTNIKEIAWDTDYCFSCPRCGSIVSRERKHLSGTCSHCGFTAVEVMEGIGNALVTFEGILPKCLDLIDISEKTVIEVLHKECPYDGYEDEDVFLRFSECTVVSQNMPQPVKAFASEGDWPDNLSLLVKVKCNAEWLKGREQHG